MNDNSQWPSDDAPNGPFVLVWHNPGGGLKSIYHMKDGCEYSRPGYAVDVKYVFLELFQASDRFGMRCCKNCARIYEPTLVQVRLRKALDRFFDLRPGNGIQVANDLSWLEQALADVGLEVIKKKGT